MKTEVLSAVEGLCATETPSEVYSATVAAAADLLNSDVIEVAIAKEDSLIVQARSTGSSDAIRQPYLVDVSIPGGAYSSGRTCLVDDCLDTRSSAETQDASSDSPLDFRSILCVPISNEGVFIAKATAPGALTDTDRDIAEHLVSCAEAALGRIQPASRTLYRDGGPGTNGGRPNRLEEIAHILAHDVKSPLNVAQGSLKMARQTGDDDHLERTERAIERVGEIIDSVVTLARTGEQFESTEPVELRATVKRAWETVRTDQATIKLVETATIQANEQGLCQLLENIIENAVTHAGPDVTVTIGMIEDGFYIEDDGPGIPPEHQDDIFDRGYSLADGHSGLGLSIAEQLAKAHGWTVTLTAEEGGGARFEVRDVQIVHS